MILANSYDDSRGFLAKGGQSVFELFINNYID